MAKTVKCKGEILILLNGIFGKFPQDKLQESSMKVLNFFRAVKKPIRKFLDMQSDVQKKARESVESLTEETKKIDLEVEGEAKKEAELKLKKLQKEIEKKLEPFNEELEKNRKEFAEKECEAVFDNEDFNFVELSVKINPVAFFGFVGKDQMGADVKATDFDAMTKVMDFFESAV